ncbi:MAG: hypothetical protein AAB432_02205 [Patescibacteria group bacterium]
MSTVKSVTKKQSQEKQVTPDIKLVLNGGSNILDTATVPVEWHFSDELIEKKPRYILICEHNDISFNEFKEIINYYHGRRHTFPVEDLVGYIQLCRPGQHHFIAIVFCGDKETALKNVRLYIKKDEDSYYDMSINYGMVGKSVKENSENTFSAAVAVEFEVPAELFAEKPKTVFGQFIWDWVNRWFKRPPIDQCAYRKRKLFAFTLQPPLLIIGRLIIGLIGTFYTLIGSSFLLFLGYQPIPVFKNILNSWIDIDNSEMNLYRFGSEFSWRKWGNEKTMRHIPILAVPYIFLSLSLVVAGITTYIIQNLGVVSFVVVSMAFIFVLFLLLFFIMKKIMTKEWKEKREQRAIEKLTERNRMKTEQILTEDRVYFENLRANISLENIPLSVDVKKILPKVNIKTRFQLSFWGMKAKVCRPFAK